MTEISPKNVNRSIAGKIWMPANCALFAFSLVGGAAMAAPLWRGLAKFGIEALRQSCGLVLRAVAACGGLALSLPVPQLEQALKDIR